MLSPPPLPALQKLSLCPFHLHLPRCEHTESLGPGHHRHGRYLSDSEIVIADFAQVCLGPQQGGQLGLGQQVPQVIGGSQCQLGHGQADSPVGVTHA